MPRRVISEETVAQAASLRKGGLSFRAIGAKLGIDPRTAKSWSARATALDQKQHWEVVEQRMDTQYLEEHYQLLRYVGAGIMRAVGTNILEAQAEPEALISHQVAVSLVPAEKLLRQRGLVIEAGPLEDPFVPVPVLQRLVESLKEHEPGLAEALDGPAGWTKQWRRFQLAREDLTKQATGLLSRRDLERETIQEMAESLVARVLPGSCGDANTGIPQSLEAPEKKPVYAGVLEQLNHHERKRPMLDAHQALSRASVRVEDLVRDLQLRGRPAGRCFLCPSRGEGLVLALAAPVDELRAVNAAVLD